MTEGQIKDGLKLLGGIGQHMMYASLLLSSRMEGLVILLLLCMIFTLLRPIFLTPGDLGRQGMAANTARKHQISSIGNIASSDGLNGYDVVLNWLDLVIYKMTRGQG